MRRSAIAVALHRHRRATAACHDRAAVGGEQGGFALLATIIIIGATSVLIMALLGLSLAASRYSVAQVERDAETRSGDGALDAAVNVLRNEARKVGRYEDTDPCVLAEVNSDGLPAMEIDGEEVVVTCTPQAPDAPPAPLQGEPASEQVRVVGTDYGGANVPAAAVWNSAMAALPAADAAAAASYAASGATVLHSGPGPLTFSSDVAVRAGAAAVRNPDVVAGRSQGPGLAVSGLYTQGDSGLSDTNQPNTQDCGAQSRWNDPAVRAVWFTSILIEPKCNVARARDLTPANAAQAPPVRWPNTALDTPRALPSCPSVANIVRIPPGVYGPAQTATLNQWFSTSTCNNKTFVFAPADPATPANYFFDVGGDGALVFNDPTSNIIFGAPGRVWDVTQSPPAADVAAYFPKACDVNSDGGALTQTGVTITLSTRTTLRHLSGRVAICDQRVTKDPVGVIWQAASVTAPWGPTGPTASPAPTQALVANPGSAVAVNFSDPANVRVSDGARARAEAWCGPVGGGLIIRIIAAVLNLERCNRVSTAQLLVPQWDAPIPTASTPIDSLVLDVVGTQRWVGSASARLRVRLTGANIGGGFCEAVFSPTYPPGVLTKSFELLDSSAGDCDDRIDDALDLVGVATSVIWDFYPLCQGARGPGYNFGTDFCKRNDKPTISVDSLALTARSKLDKGPIPAGSTFTVTSDVANGTSFNVFGQTSTPRADVDIRWNGTPTQDPVSGNVLPIFGGTMVVNGIGSVAPTTQVAGAFVARPGIVCCAIAEPSERLVVLNAWTDVTEVAGSVPKVFNGRLVATARVALKDFRVGITGLPEFAPGNAVRVENWQLCDSAIGPLPGTAAELASPTCSAVSG